MIDSSQAFSRFFRFWFFLAFFQCFLIEHFFTDCTQRRKSILIQIQVFHVSKIPRPWSYNKEDPQGPWSYSEQDPLRPRFYCEQDPLGSWTCCKQDTKNHELIVHKTPSIMVL